MTDEGSRETSGEDCRGRGGGVGKWTASRMDDRELSGGGGRWEYGMLVQHMCGR